MGAWSALRFAMSTRRARRIGLTEADQLVAGSRTDPGLEGLAGLLDAVRSPAPGVDLAGERAAVAGFLAARQRDVPAAPPRKRTLVARALAVKVALVIAVLAFGGTALAARTGSLPSAVQERAHALFSDVGVPPPGREPGPQITRGGVPATSAPTPSPAPSRSPASGPSSTADVELCRAWDAARRDPPGQAVPAPARRALAAAAGGEPKIDDFCAGLLRKPSATGQPAVPGKTPAAPSAPGAVPPTVKPPGTPGPSEPAPGTDKEKEKEKEKDKDRDKDREKDRDRRNRKSQAPPVT